jgi:hypothetical protein
MIAVLLKNQSHERDVHQVLGPPGEKTLSQLRAVQEPVTIEKNIKTLEAFSLLHDRKVTLKKKPLSNKTSD